MYVKASKYRKEYREQAHNIKCAFGAQFFVSPVVVIISLHNQKKFQDFKVQRTQSPLAMYFDNTEIKI